MIENGYKATLIISRRLDKGEEIDNDTESINREKDLVTKSKLVGSLGDGALCPRSDREFVHQSESQFDIDTKSKPYLIRVPLNPTLIQTRQYLDAFALA